MDKPDGHVGAAHDEFAVRHVDDAHHAEHDREAGGGQNQEREDVGELIEIARRYQRTPFPGRGDAACHCIVAERRAAGAPPHRQARYFGADCSGVYCSLRFVLGQVAADLAQPVRLDAFRSPCSTFTLCFASTEISRMRWADVLALRIDADLALRRVDAGLAGGDHLAHVGELGRLRPSRPASCT